MCEGNGNLRLNLLAEATVGGRYAYYIGNLGIFVYHTVALEDLVSAGRLFLLSIVVGFLGLWANTRFSLFLFVCMCECVLNS